MSDLTWTEMPEVNPEQPDELVLDFSGEIYRVQTYHHSHSYRGEAPCRYMRDSHSR